MKYTLETDPTFKAEVGLHMPGKGNATVVFEFKARTRQELDDYQKQLSEDAEKWRELIVGEPTLEDTMRAEAKQIMGLAVGWRLPAAFSEENLLIMLNKTPDAMQVIFRTYLRELSGGRAGN